MKKKIAYLLPAFCLAVALIADLHAVPAGGFADDDQHTGPAHADFHDHAHPNLQGHAEHCAFPHGHGKS